MPRPRTIADADVLAAASRVVGRGGPARLTLAAVGAECGLSASTIVQRFGSKRGLLLALSAHGRDDVAPVFEAAARESPSARAAIVDALSALASSVTTREQLANHLAFLQLDLVDPDLQRLARDHARSVARSLAALVAKAVLSGELVERDPQAAAHALLVTYNGALLTWAIDPRGSLRERLRADVEATLGAWGPPARADWRGAAS